MARLIAALRQTSDSELIREHDELAQHTVLGTDFYVQELFRRATERASEETHNLAVKVYRLTVVATTLSVAAVFLAVIALFR